MTYEPQEPPVEPVGLSDEEWERGGQDWLAWIRRMDDEAWGEFCLRQDALDDREREQGAA